MTLDGPIPAGRVPGESLVRSVLGGRLGLVAVAIGLAAFVAVGTAASSGEPLRSASGTKPSRVRCSGIVVKRGDDLQAKIDAHRAGTTFCLEPGKYRLTDALVLKSRDVLNGGGRRAVFDGSKDITSAFTRAGSIWVASGQTQSLTYTGQCEATKPLCEQADDVFYDGRPLVRVGAVADVRPGRFYFDHTGDRIYIGNNPAGHRVEAAVAVEAVHGWDTGADAVTITGLVVQHFGNRGIQCRGDTWTVASSVIRWNHGDGLQDCATVVNSVLYDNGKSGYVFAGRIGVSQGPYLFSHNTVSANNYAGFDPNWEAGGAKFMQMAHLTVSHNVVTGNDGNGLWTDWGNRFVTYDANTVTKNTHSGISHEASYDATISNNTITGNGTACSSTLCKSGILLNDSQNVDIVGNRIAGNQNGIGITQINRGSTALGPLVTQNVFVRNNTISRSGRSGLVQWDGDGSYYTSRNNRFSHNTYVVCGDTRPFVWQNPARPSSYSNLSWREWQAAGNDTDGSYGCRSTQGRG